MPLSLQALRQSAAELLACAFCELFPKAQLVNGTSTGTGFYYDFIFNQQIDEQALSLLEERMRAIIHQNLPVQTLDMMRENAAVYFLHSGQKLKAELTADIPANIVQVLKMGNFIDICEAPYMTATKEISAIKLQGMNQTTVYHSRLGPLEVLRIHGTAFHEQYAMKQFLKRAEKAKKQDHRRLGPEMLLYSSPHDTDTCLWEPKGCLLRQLLQDFWKHEHKGLRLLPLSTPRIASATLLETALTKEALRKKKSNPSDILSLPFEGLPYAVCPDPTLLHARACSSTLYTHRQLPISYYEFVDIGDTTPRHQQWGLFTTRTYTSDLTQILCTPEQVAQELISCLQFIDKIIKILGFEHQWYLSTREQIPARYKGEWRLAYDQLAAAMKHCGLDHSLNKQTGAPYGPQAELRLTDAWGQQWKGPYVTVNALLTEDIELRYYDEQDQARKLTMLTRSIFGSLERFIGILIEHYHGELPLWISPEQVRLIPIAHRNAEYTKHVEATMASAGFRTCVDDRPDALGTKIHAAEKQKVPFIVILGDKEEKKNVLTVRSRNNKTENSLPLEQFMAQLNQDSR